MTPRVFWRSLTRTEQRGARTYALVICVWLVLLAVASAYV